MPILNYVVGLAVGLLSVGGVGSLVAKQLHLPPAQYKVKVERQLSFKTSDGTKLSADVFHPVGMKTTPTILVRIPVSATVETCFLEEVIGRLWAERGFTAVIQGTRGRLHSGGLFYPMKYERADGIETLKWLSKQAWYNGKIGAWGGSAYGQTLWSIADQKNPSIDSMEVYFTSSDFRRLFYQGNAFSLYSALGWTLRSHDEHSDEDKWPDSKRIFAAANGWPMKDSDRRDLGRPVKFFQDWLRSKDDDSYWRQINGACQTTKYGAPVLFLAGWFDPFLAAELDDFKNASKADKSNQTRIVIGPWSHARDVKLPNYTVREKFRPTSIATSIPWFATTLIPSNASHPIPSKISLFVMGVNRWRNESEWPLLRTTYVPMFLSGNSGADERSSIGVLSAKETEQSSINQFAYDPNDPVVTKGGAMIGPAAGVCLQNEIERRKDVLTYTTSTLSHDVEVTGNVKATLYVSTDCPSTDFTVKLVDVHPDGKAFNVCSGILRQSYDDSKKVFCIDVDLTSTSMVFLQGHKIRVDISSSDFPRFDRNPNTGVDSAVATKSRIAHQKLFSSRELPSRIILPVIPAPNSTACDLP